jgi:hypothetical protein
LSEYVREMLGLMVFESTEKMLLQWVAQFAAIGHWILKKRLVEKREDDDEGNNALETKSSKVKGLSNACSVFDSTSPTPTPYISHVRVAAPFIPFPSLFITALPRVLPRPRCLGPIFLRWYKSLYAVAYLHAASSEPLL